MADGLELRVISDKIPALLAAMPGRVDEILSKVAQDIVADAQARSRVDTGEMKAGWTAERESENTWIVHNPVEHTIYNEFGTVHMSAAPMLIPAVEAQRSTFEQAFKALFEGL